MKKNKNIFALGSLLVAIVLFSSVRTADAAELNLKTEPFDSQNVTIAKQNWEKYLSNFLLDTNEDITDFYLGQGFKIANPNNENLVAFPIVKKQNEEISYVLQIDSDYQIILSQKFGEKLNDLSNEIKQDNDKAPTISMSKQSLYSVVNDRQTLLLGNDSFEAPIELRNLGETKKITDVLENANEMSVRETFDHVVLPWKAYEIQKDKPWCEWYAQTGIINNLGNKLTITAEQMIKGQYPKATDKQLNDTSWIVQQNLLDNFKYLKNKFGMDIKYKASAPTFTEIKSELKNRKTPIVVDLSSAGGQESYGHALVQMGYTASTSGISSEKPYYYYWNPWWNDTFVVSSASEYMQLGINKYKPTRYQYNFSKP